MPLIQIFIATYNRPSLVLNAIHSALNQSFDSFEVIVSDNSTNDDTGILISKIEDKRLSYKRRKPTLPAIDHLNTILKDVTADYFMIFHDDDVMHKNMLELQYSAFTKYENILAVGANASIVSNNRNNNKNIFRTTKKDLILTSPIDVAKQYGTYGGIVPFPSYLYRLKVAKNLKFDLSKGGKYCDAAFILDIQSLGNIIFLVTPLMDYYIHNTQDSAKYSFEQEAKLIRYFCKRTGLVRNNILIKKMRFRSIYLALKQEISTDDNVMFSNRYFKLLGILIKSGNFDYSIRLLILTAIKLF